MNKPTVMIGVPSGSGLLPLPMVSSLLHLRKPCDTSFVAIERQRIDKARNIIASAAIDAGVDYLLFIDDDNPIPPDTLELMLADDKDVVAAAIPTRLPDAQGQHKICAMYRDDRVIPARPGVDDKPEILRYYNMIEMFRDEGPLHQVDGVGTGCVLIKRKVLEEVRKKHEYIFEFGDTVVNGKRRTMSEDAEFSERVADLGFEMWVDDRIRPVHISSPIGVMYTDSGIQKVMVK